VSKRQPTYIALRLPQVRQERGVSQREQATELGVSKATIESWEQSLREPGDDVLPEVERLIALGERRPGEDAPLYLIASVGPDGRPVPLPDADARPCVVRARHPAAQVVEFLRASGMADAAFVPVWRAHLDTLPPGHVVGLNVDDLDLAAYNAGLLRWASEVLERSGEAAAR
jgi:transcriptional regulator with XRE-family HTH domain